MELFQKIIPLPKKTVRPVGTYWEPSRAFISELSAFLSGKKVLEIFAGNGLLAGLLAKEGVDVTATSILSGMDAHSHGLYHPVEHLGACKAVQKYADAHDVLLICWPTTVDDVFWASMLWGSEKDIVYIGEKTDYEQGFLGGCATDIFFQSVEFHRHFMSYEGRRDIAAVARFSRQI